jgi:hypothetical protein
MMKARQFIIIGVLGLLPLAASAQEDGAIVQLSGACNMTPAVRTAIARSLTDEGRIEELAGVASLSCQPKATCLTLLYQEGTHTTAYPVNLPEGLAWTNGQPQWTPGEIQALLSQGVPPKAVAEVFNLRQGVLQMDIQTPTPTALNPGCGECLSGNMCLPAGAREWTCCNASSGQACTTCRVCPPKTVDMGLGIAE